MFGNRMVKKNEFVKEKKRGRPPKKNEDYVPSEELDLEDVTYVMKGGHKVKS